MTPDPSPTTAPDHLLRAAADLLAARPGGVLAGPTAGALWIGPLSGLAAGDEREAGSTLLPALLGRPAEVVVPGRGGRSTEAARVRADWLDTEEVREVWRPDVGWLRLTTPLRTSFDLARALPVDEAVAVVDALGARHGITPERLRGTAHHHPGVRGRRAVFPVADLMDEGSSSPGRTRVRLALRRAGLDAPLAGRVIVDDTGEVVGALDLVWLADRCGLQVGRTWEEGRARVGRLPALGWYVRNVPDDADAEWLGYQALALLEERRGRRWPPLVTRSDRRRRRSSVR